jgi:hypothetical protein
VTGVGGIVEVGAVEVVVVVAAVEVAIIVFVEFRGVVAGAGAGAGTGAKVGGGGGGIIKCFLGGFVADAGASDVADGADGASVDGGC